MLPLAPLLALLSRVPALLGPITSVLTGINFQAVGDFLAKYWQYVLILLLVISLGGTGYWSHHEHLLDVSEKAAHALDIKNYRDAQLTAEANAKAEKAQLNKEAQANAKQANARYSTLLAQYRANLVRFKAAQSAARTAGHSQLPGTQGGNGSSSSSNVPANAGDKVTISMDDAQVCAVNTARLKAVQEWATQNGKDVPKE